MLLTPSDKNYRDFIGYGREGLRAVWPKNARVAICIVINYEEGSEYSFANGDGRNEIPQEFDYPPLPVRDFGNESIFEYGSRAGIWRLQRLLDGLNIPATIQGCAQAFELNPEVGAWIAESGNDVCCHGYRWENVSVLKRDEERERLKMAIESIQHTCGQRPRGWYSRQPSSPNTRELLVEEGGFIYDSDSFADDLPYFVPVQGKEHLIIPYSFTLNDGRFLPGQSYTGPDVFLDHCKRAFDYLWMEGETHPKLMTIGLHPRIIGQPARAHALREFLMYALDRGDVWFTKREEIAEWWMANHGTSASAEAEDWKGKVVADLLNTTGASRTTIRLIDDDDHLYLAAERLAAGVQTMTQGPEIDPRQHPTYQYLEAHQDILIQEDCRSAKILPPSTLIDHHRVFAQMLAPVMVEGRMRGTISVHQQDRPRAWTLGDIAALKAAQSKAEAVLRNSSTR